MGGQPDERSRAVLTCPLAADDIGEVLDLIASEQARPDRNVPTLTADREALRSELDEFEPAWTSTACVARSTLDDTVAGVILTEWNVGAGRAWIHGPWIDRDDDDWVECAISLVTATLQQFPSAVTRSVLCGGVEHHLIEVLSGALGWHASEVNHTLTVSAQRIASWSHTDTRTVAIRDIADHDDDAVRSLHDTEFPSTYYTVSQLIERSGCGEHVVLVATDDTGAVCGYTAGRVQPDGDGYIDFLAVTENSRGRGVGRALVIALGDRLVPECRTHRVCLMVRDLNRPARAMYESLGFEIDVSIAAYESSG